MRPLLSRVGQAHRYSCRSSSTVVEALGRRSTTCTRRRATFAEIFTACYSSVFATAAIVDAIRKDDRRQNLDRQLEEARRDLADLHENGSDEGDQDDDSKPQDLNMQQMDALWQTIKEIYKRRPYMKEIHKPASLNASELLESLQREYYGCIGEAPVATARQMDYEKLERALLAEELDGEILYRESWKQSHLRMETISTEEVVRKFLERARFLPDSATPSPAFDEARRLRKTGFPQYNFRGINPEEAQKNTRVLNQRLRTLVGSPDAKMGMKERIGRVCYNLLISAYPPDMHTYNTLIVAFNKAGHHTFAEALVSSFFHSRLLQPTPSTFVAILNHYQCTNNHGKFLRALACVTGLEPSIGGKMRRRHIMDIEESPSLQIWAADFKRRTQTGEWVWEHVPLHLALVEEILRGLVHFKLFDQAVAFFSSCMQFGVRLSLKTVSFLMDECVSAMDWRAAVRMMWALPQSHGKWQKLLMSGDLESRQFIAARIYAIIDFVGLSSPTEQIRPWLLVDLAKWAPKYLRFLAELQEEAPLPPGSLAVLHKRDRAKSRLLQYESLLREADLIRSTVLSIESKLLYPNHPHEFRVAMALHLGADAIERALLLDQEFRDILTGSKDWKQRAILRSLKPRIEPS